MTHQHAKKTRSPSDSVPSKMPPVPASERFPEPLSIATILASAATWPLDG